MARVSPLFLLSRIIVDVIYRVPLGLSIRELICRVRGLYAHLCHATDLRLPYPVLQFLEWYILQ